MGNTERKTGMSEWKEVKLGEICSYGKERIGVASLTSATYISTENMQPNRGGVVLASSIPDDGSVVAYKKGDVLVSNIRPYFKKIWRASHDGGCSADVLVFRNRENVDAKFLYYLLSADSFFDYSMATAKGTKMPRGDKNSLMEYGVKLPPLAEQRRIAEILGSLDDKIELNNAINKNLEEQAQTLFKNWFIDYAPFGGKMPGDWRKGTLSEIADYLNGLAMQKFRPKDNEIGLAVLKIKELRQGFPGDDAERCSPEIKPEHIVNDGDVIFSWSGSLLVDIWCGGECGLNQHLFKVTSQKYGKWFYYLWSKRHLDHFITLAADKATTMGHIKREELDKAEVCIPSEVDYKKIGATLEPIIDAIISHRIENRQLVKLRDTLLPKLMSGEQLAKRKTAEQ